MHLYGLALSGDVHGSESDDHSWLEETSLDSSDWHSSNTSDLVDVLEGESEGLVLGSLGGFECVESVDEDGTSVPLHVIGSLDHVISVPS